MADVKRDTITHHLYLKNQLKAGEVVAFPTETVYGLGASLKHPLAIQKIFQLKGRPQDNPLIVHLSSVAEIAHLAIIPEKLTLLEHLWPGPLTVVLTAKECVPSIVKGGLSTVGLRIPDHPIALELLREVGPLVAPSANLSGKPSPTEAQHVREDFPNLPILDGGPCRVGLESTILSLVGKPTILRPGAISKEELEEALGEEVIFSSSKEALAPGMKYRHYAPEAQLLLFNQVADLEHHLKEFPRKRRVVRYGVGGQDLYKFLRECDLDCVDEILLLVTESMRCDIALINRLEKASLLK